MVKKLFRILMMGILIFFISRSTSQAQITFKAYHSVNEIGQAMENLQQNHPGCELHKIATSPGGTEILVLEIGSDLEDVPAIFVGANFEGNVPISSEGALFLAKMLLDSAQYRQARKWYIMPHPNPDAALDFFAPVKTGTPLNGFEINEDADDATGEDGFDDLNGDGQITQMRVKDAEGKYIPSKADPRILVKADPGKGERGTYKTFTEGIDNDGDGKYNEDVPGGINVGIAFPHLFPHGTKEAGLFSGQTPEVYGILRFIYDRPEIAMVYTLGSSDFCTAPPKGGRKGGANLESIQIPGRYAKMLNADASKKYTMGEVMELMKAVVPDGMEVTPSLVAGFLGLGAVVNPLDDDLKFYKKFSEDYKKYLEAKNAGAETLPPTPAKNGSFELWAYYHLGVPSFSMNLFSVPKVMEEKKLGDKTLSLDEVQKMETKEFAELEEEIIDSFLKAHNAPERFKAEKLIEMMEAGKLDPLKLATMLKEMPEPEKEDELSEKNKSLLAWSDQHWGGEGFVEWQKVEHPDYDEVEVGGYLPYLENTPKAELMDSLFKTKLPWLLQLSTKLPEIEMAKAEVSNLGNGIFKLEMMVENNGFLPSPIAMGSRNNQPAPAIIVIDGDFEILEGSRRTNVGSIGGNQAKKLTWLLKTDKKTTVEAKLESTIFSDSAKQINIGG